MAAKRKAILSYFSPPAIAAGLLGLVLLILNVPILWDLSLLLWRWIYSDWRDVPRPGLIRSFLPWLLCILQFVLIGTITAGYSKRYPLTQVAAVAALGPVVGLGAARLIVLFGYHSLELFFVDELIPIIFLLLWPVGVICGVLGAALRPGRRKSTVLLAAYCAVTIVLCLWRFASKPLAEPDIEDSGSLKVELPNFGGIPLDHAPQICTGYQPFIDRKPHWGPVAGEGCPPNYTAFAGRPPVAISRFAIGAEVPLRALCCPLPAGDILSGSVEYVNDECPEGFVMTGGNDLDVCPDCKGLVRCSEINRKRYQLGAKTPGVYSAPRQRLWRSGRNINPYAVPAGLRYGLHRAELYRLSEPACLGYPFGSLLTAKHGKRCNDFIFRQLQYRGLPGDPPQGTPVRTYAACDAVSSLFDSHPDCLRARTVTEDEPAQRDTEGVGE